MKYAQVVTLATAVNTVALPDGLVSSQAVMEESLKAPTRGESWWGETPNNGYVRAVEKFVNTVAESAEHTIDSAMQGVERMGEALGRELGSLLEGMDPEEDRDGNRNRNRRRKGHGHDENDQTIWEMIKESHYTKRFCKLVEEYDDVKERLKDTKNDYTLFVPTDQAFDNLPDHHKPSKEFLEEILEYHIVPGRYTAGRVMSAHTLPTALELRDLGHHHQRLRFSIGLTGLYVNFYSRVVATNIAARNGYIHAVNRILVPPPRQGRLIDALPGKFSTFSLAMERTGLGAHLHRQPQRGGTVFAPTNDAWAKLGPRLNEFLFSARGDGYLRALLRYHVVANETLYSDAYYDDDNADRRRKGDREGGRAGPFPGGNYHVQMRTELGDKRVGVDIRRWLGMVSMTVNGWISVSVQDGISQDGVVHVVESVLMPPRRSRPDEDNPDDDYENDNMSVEELRERLDKYVNDHDHHSRSGDRDDRRDRDRDDRKGDRRDRDRDDHRGRDRHDRHDRHDRQYL